MATVYPYRARAARILVLCCLFWAFSFPVMKGLQMLAQARVPQGNTVFASAVCMTLRFGFSALLVGLFVGRDFRRLTRLEWQQGVIVGAIGAVGLLFQLDGLAYTQASTSAFLTQGYCVLIPVWLAWRRRRWPPTAVWIACALAIAGAAVLAEVHWTDFRLGRGELETLLGSVFFAGQILWVEAPRFAGNDTLRWSTVMFATIAVLGLPLSLLTAPHPADVVRVFATPAGWVLIGILVGACTLVSYLLMNRWQRELPATEAGLLYCTEPVFAAGLSLVMPGWITAFAGVTYANEQLGTRTVIGGVLILAANVWLQLRGAEPGERT